MLYDRETQKYWQLKTKKTPSSAQSRPAHRKLSIVGERGYWCFKVQVENNLECSFAIFCKLASPWCKQNKLEIHGVKCSLANHKGNCCYCSTLYLISTPVRIKKFSSPHSNFRKYLSPQRFSDFSSPTPLGFQHPLGHRDRGVVEIFLKHWVSPGDKAE